MSFSEHLDNFIKQREQQGQAPGQSYNVNTLSKTRRTRALPVKRLPKRRKKRHCRPPLKRSCLITVLMAVA